MIDLTLDAEQQEIVNAAIELLADVAPVSRLRSVDGDRALFATLANWGWFGVSVPAVNGGLGLGLIEEAQLYLAAGRHLVSPSVLATELAATCGPAELRRAMATGEARAALGLPGSDAFMCFDAEGADTLVTIGSDDIQFFELSRISGAPVEGLDEALATWRCEIAGEPAATSPDSARALLLLTALLAGCARGAANLAIEYAKVREQFGQPIGAFQAVKHRCVDMGVSAFAAEAQVTMAAVALAEGAPGAERELAAAAIAAVKAGRANGAGTVQVHGGMGFTAECDAHRFLKRAQVLIRLLGREGRYAAAML